MIKPLSFAGILFLLSFTSCKKYLSPEVSTSEVTNILYTTATCGGEIIDDGGSSIVSQGVCWGTSNDPTTSDNISTFTLAVSSFAGTISHLNPNTTYYLRAFATNDAGTGYGKSVTFTTKEIKAPSLITSPIAEITESSAKSQGTLIDNNGSEISALGICYSATSNPQIADSVILVGIGVGTFEAVLEGLLGNTTYYVRAFATNSAGTGYGNEVIFKTNPPIVPKVVTTEYSLLTDYSFKSGGIINYCGGAEISSCGLCWNTSPNPTTSNNRTVESNNSGQFTGTIENLRPNTLYYVRAYASNIAGTSYGNEIQVRTYAAMDVDGNGYNSIQLGTQVWMKENLKTTKYRNGDPIGTTNPPNKDITNETEPKYQWAYNGMEANSAEYGRLYTWYAVIDSRSICPKGWHVPMQNDWETLEAWLINNGYECTSGTNYEGKNKLGKSMADTILWLTSDIAGAVGNNDSPEYRNKSGFSGLPAGMRHTIGIFEYLKINALWSTWSDQWGIIVHIINYKNNYLGEISIHRKSDGFSVRCMKDIVE